MSSELQTELDTNRLADGATLTSVRDWTEQELDDTYDGLRNRARHVMQQFPGTLTLQPTAVLHEALIKLWNAGRAPTSRQGFMMAVSIAMRDVLIDNLRRRLAQKRGGGRRAAALDGEVPSGSWRLFEDKMRVHEAIEELRQRSPRMADVVEMRFFGGFGLSEIARELRVSRATAERDAARGRAILYALLNRD